MKTHLFKKWACAIVVVVAACTGANAASWNNTDTGASAGDWFNPFNWNPTIAPDLTVNAEINNGGEARANAATALGDLQANLLEVGTNSFTGTLTSVGVNVITAGDLDVGQAFNSIFAPIPSTQGSGTVTVSDTALVDIGSSLDIGKTAASGFKTARGSGAVVFERVTSIVIDDGIDVGEAVSDTGWAYANGSLRISDSDSLNIGNDLDVGEAFAANSISVARGTATIERVDNVAINGDLEVGLSTMSQNGMTPAVARAASSIVSITDAASVSVRRKTRLGKASATGNGVAFSNASLVMERAGDIDLQNDVEIGLASAIGTTEADATGYATFDGGGTLVMDGDVTVGQAVAADAGQATGKGSLTVRQFDSLLITDDVRVGRVNSTILGPAPSTANATGSVTLEDIEHVTIEGDLHVGFGNNDRLGPVSTATGSLTIQNVGLAELNTELFVGYARAGTFSTIATGSATITDSRVVTPVVEIGVAFNRLSLAEGAVTLNRSSLQANSIRVGRDADTTDTVAFLPMRGALTLTDSTVETDFLTVADRVFPGSVTGRVSLRRSLATVNDTLLLYESSELTLAIEGAVRGDQYGAIDAGIAQLDGSLQIAVEQGFVPSYFDEFEVVTAATRIGEFEEITGLLVGPDVTLVPVYDHNNSVGLTLVAALPGDANLDGIVNGEDLLAWQANLFNGDEWVQGDFNLDGLVSGLDLLIWQAHLFNSVPSPAGPVTQATLAVPEPASLWLLGAAVVFCGGVRNQVRLQPQKRVHRKAQAS